MATTTTTAIPSPGGICGSDSPCAIFDGGYRACCNNNGYCGFNETYCLRSQGCLFDCFDVINGVTTRTSGPTLSTSTLSSTLTLSTSSTMSTMTSASATSSARPANGGLRSGTKKGIIAGTVVGGILLFVLLFLLIRYYLRRHKERQLAAARKYATTSPYRRQQSASVQPAGPTHTQMRQQVPVPQERTRSEAAALEAAAAASVPPYPSNAHRGHIMRDPL